MIKKNKKGVSVILSLVVITGIILVSIIFAYRWGMPIVQTNKEIIELENFIAKFSELKSDITRISIEGNLSSRKVIFNVKKGSIMVNPNRDFIKYSLTLKDRLCDDTSTTTLTLDNTSVVPSGVISLSGEIFETYHSFDNDTRQIIVADSDNRYEYNDLYISSVQEPTCFERYNLNDIIITEKNKYGIIFTHTRTIGDDLEVTFTFTSKKEDNLYHLCGSGGSTTQYDIYLKYKNPTYGGINCEDIDHFGEIDIISSAYCNEKCSLTFINQNGNIKVDKF